MESDTLALIRAREAVLAKRRAWYLLAAALAALSVWLRLPVAFVAALFALIIGIVPELWYRFALRALNATQRVSVSRAMFGQTIVLDVQIENRKRLPLPWLEIEDEIPDQLPLLTGRASPSYKVRRALLTSALSLWGWQRVTRRYRLRCAQRGQFTFGPLTVRNTDPFGWLQSEQTLGSASAATVLVLPLVAPLTAFQLPARHPFGELTTPQRLLEDPARIVGVRPYALGDDPRRVHWKATARAGTLQSKQFEPGSQHRLMVVLDVRTFSEPWMGIDPEVQELLIALAASLSTWALDAGYAVGLLANSLPMRAPDEHEGATPRDFARRLRLPIGRGPAQRERLLVGLARLVPYFGVALAPLLVEEALHLPVGTTVVVVSARLALADETVDALLALRRRGMSAHLVLAGDPDQPVLAATLNLPIYHAGGREVWRALCNASDEPPAVQLAR